LIGDIPIERLNVFAKKPQWEVINIESFPRLAGFGYSYDNSS